MRFQVLLFGAAGLGLVVGSAVLAQGGPPAAAATASCEGLGRAALHAGRVERAETIRAGFFVPIGPGQGPQPQPVPVKAFCRLVLTLTPSKGSNIRSEVWLPAAGWNGKFMMVGNGAWGGAIDYQAIAVPLARGYAAAATDTGHVGVRGDFALNKPELWTDYGWRAVHETAEAGKALTAAFYGAPPAHAYWNGCSTGGKQGLKAVQAFPADFDGVIAGAAANNWARLQTRSIWMSRINLPVPDAQPVLGQADFDLLNRAAVAACDGLDGVVDGEIADPRQCRFKPATLACRRGAGPSPGQCLTRGQVEVANKLYGGPKLRNGQPLYPASAPGAEPEMMRVAAQPWAPGLDQFRFYAAGAQANWDFRTLDLDRDVERAEAFDNGTNNAVDPDLSAYKARGGKLIQYHGWADGLVSAEGSINYYEAVAARQGGLDPTRDFHRLFMIPAMNHCAGGYQLDFIAALEAWVEHGQAPDAILGQRIAPPLPNAPPNAPPRFDGARPICAYPAVARYAGPGAANDPASFTCVPGPRGARKGQGPATLGGPIAALYPAPSRR